MSATPRVEFERVVDGEVPETEYAALVDEIPGYARAINSVARDRETDLIQ